MYWTIQNQSDYSGYMGWVMHTENEANEVN